MSANPVSVLIGRPSLLLGAAVNGAKAASLRFGINMSVATQRGCMLLVVNSRPPAQRLNIIYTSALRSITQRFSPTVFALNLPPVIAAASFFLRRPDSVLLTNSFEIPILRTMQLLL